MNPSIKLAYLSARAVDARRWTPLFLQSIRAIGDLRLFEGTGQWDPARVAEVVREHDVVLTDWGSRPLPEELAERPGRLKLVCHLAGSVRPFVPRRLVEQGIPVTNWGPLPSFGIAEAALTLLLAVLKELLPHNREIQAGGWGLPPGSHRGSVRHLRLGVYGLGVIGRRFLEMVRPLEPRLFAFDPYLEDWPEDVHRVASVDELMGTVEAVVILAALTGETRGSVGAAQLARLPEGGVVINVARGGIVDQSALFAELESGRLRAGLDVLDTDGSDRVPPGHPSREWPNLLLTAHTLGSSPWNQSLYDGDHLNLAQEIALDNLRRFAAGQPLQHSFDLIRYDRST